MEPAADTATIIMLLLLGLSIILVLLLLKLHREKKGRLALEKRVATLLEVETDLRRESAELKALKERFAPVLDIEAELRRLGEAVTAKSDEIELLRTDYRSKRTHYDALLKEVAIFDEKIAFAEMGLYEPHFDFTDSDAYKAAIAALRDEQKAMITAGTAVICTKNWTVDGSASKGKTMTNRAIRLTLRAFNNECDAAIANTRWNNVNAMEKRIIRAAEQIDKLNASNAVNIAEKYLALKLQELYLTHEHREKLKQEREERAEAARLAREEQKLLKELEDAQREEDRYQKMLQKARAEVARGGPQLEEYMRQVEALERQLAEAHAATERAQAMAEKTRSGYVYVISNVGSFGPDVVKIGMTRRLDPTDRVKELGDASVPFSFDTHAMIYSDDAPALEHALHTQFASVRINTENPRKEFFRATLQQVEEAVRRMAPDATFFRDIEAQEYQESLARRRALMENAAPAHADLLPAEI